MSDKHGDRDEKGQTGFKVRGRNSDFAPRAEKGHCRDQSREGRGGGVAGVHVSTSHLPW